MSIQKKTKKKRSRFFFEASARFYASLFEKKGKRALVKKLNTPKKDGEWEVTVTEIKK